EDKVERAARQQHRSAWDIARAYEAEFLQDLARLHIEAPQVLPRATEHIPQQIALVQRLEAKGCTYRTADGIYFDTSRFPDYGRLARLDVQGLQEGQRVEVGEKRHKTDFALWKFSPPGAQRQMEWDSPWGRGFPGWHIECSAMSMAYLGETFDLHTGGTDHIPVHHTNEIAQSEAATGKPFVRCWLHGEHLVLGKDQRMGKSEGNLVRLQDLVEQGFDPLAYRYLVLNTHYRKFLNFSLEALRAADTALLGLRALLRGAAAPAGQAPPGAGSSPVTDEILGAFCDDLNTPKALGLLWTALKDPDVAPATKRDAARMADQVLSLDLCDFRRLEQHGEIPPQVQALAERRWAARQSRDFAESDRLREELGRQGYTMRDSKDGYELVRN
ncbi:MAG TPA: cysteine--tRNA ligase, partial [bacterium]|nr:cysteine--tRNA ligase [bacterium]